MVIMPGLLESPSARSVSVGFSDFQAAASTQFVPLKVSTDAPGRFHGSMRSTRVDDIHAVDIAATPHVVERTPEMIARGGQDRYKLTLQLSGSGMLIQDGREAVLQTGDIAVYDTNRPYSLIFDDPCRILVFMFPRKLLELPVDAVGQVTAVRFPGDEGVGAVVGPLLARTAHPLGSLSASAATRLTYGALDFVTTLLANALDLRQDPLDPRSALVRQIHAYVLDHLGSPNLGPGQIAAAHYISTRHLHDLFHLQGTTVSSWIRTQRLERCRRDLTDSLLAARSVGAIAARWGFTDAAHFSRIFKATFGVSPSGHRAGAGA
ncbi:MAG: helix-turn-helix domain-containing protein [Pseudolysinimonas sp.]